jgi:hypothetical protein
MLEVHPISPNNEMPAVERLRRDILACWPDLADDKEDRIDLLVGIRTSVDVDLLIAVDFAEPRTLAIGPAKSETPIASGVIVVEIKQLDAQRFERRGNQLFARYERVEQRSVVDQARDAAYGVKRFAESSGCERLFIYAVAWLTEVDEAHLRDVDSALVGQHGGWRGIVGAALSQRDALTRADDRIREHVRAVRERLLLRRRLSPLDRTRAERVARDAVLADLVSALAERAGRGLIRLAGHGGCGKTTALTLLAARLATAYGGRVLVLTFHQALCGDIRAAFENMADVRALNGKTLSVRTATGFLLELLAASGDVPLRDDGKADYDHLDEAYREATALFDDGGDAGSTAASLIASDRERFGWDHILIDEAQDWTDAERDLLRAVYGHRRLILADGLMQLVRRQVPCDWLREVPSEERAVRFLGKSLRMLRNVALFANAFASAIGFQDWNVDPHPELGGGRIVIVEGELRERLSLVTALQEDATAANARPVDNLICVPPTEVTSDANGIRRSRVGLELTSAGMPAWDACEPAVRGVAPEGDGSWRIVQYDSCRGLQGWAVLSLALDDFYANKIKHPNLHAGDAPVDPEFAAWRWLLIPLTRAVAHLVIHVRDPASPVAARLREAANAMPAGVVEWRTA